ncbi:VOC family protein [Longispora sp. NPDC051575]|uniref:VOC family protein n=1 Tax=Longispora sp. NPDC051575 TaxID=3154943 RepID=UPI0034264C06
MIKLGSVALDCPDPAALAGFYAELLDRKVTYTSDDWVTVGGDGVDLSFQRVADYRAPRWPDPEAPQQSHLDLTVADLDAGEAKALALGARPLDTRKDRGWRVYADPVGHPFCLCKE